MASTIASAIKAKGNKISARFKQVTNGIGQKVDYMSIPAGFATLPSDASVIQIKHLNSKGPKGEATYVTYVLACGKKNPANTRKGYVQNWYVSEKHYFGGKPAFDKMLYNGTDERSARKRFGDIPYNELLVKLPDNGQAPYGSSLVTREYNGKSTKWARFAGNGTYAEIAANRHDRYVARGGAKFARKNSNGYSNTGAYTQKRATPKF